MTLLPRHRILHVAIDAALVAAAWYLAFQLRFDAEVPRPYERLFEETLPLVIGVKAVVFVLAGLYRHWWRYVSIRDMWSAARAVAIASLVVLLAIYVWNPVRGFRVPSGVVAIDFLLLLGLVAGTRLVARTIVERPVSRSMFTADKDVLIVGAGDAGQLIVKEMFRKPELGYMPIGLVDDDTRLRNMRLHGVRVLGASRDLRHLLRAHKPDEVIIAMPGASGEKRQEIVTVCRDVGVPVKTLPAMRELISGDADLARQLREVQVEDILGREPVELDPASIASYLEGETVLVTGAGGSIGSELCRQIARVRPASLVLVDQAETPLVDISRELGERGFSAAVPILADVKDRAKMREVFERYRPAVVFHAAAYKHVPLMEGNAVESVRNNVLATKVLAEVASEQDAKRFVLVSTDKAVDPKSVLGQTKAICEWIVAAAAARERNGTAFISVRFGNVLGSSGSVIPLFRKQIANGGPVTVTHLDMTRYFMTISEAAQLIVQAGAMGESGDVFVLDMGTPVKIVDLAHNMIRLSGKEPERDIAIEFIGTRPGEKLHEELWGEREHAVTTPHPKILRCAGQPIDPLWLDEEVAELERLSDAGETLDVVQKLREIVAAPIVAAPQRLGAATVEPV